MSAIPARGDDVPIRLPDVQLQDRIHLTDGKQILTQGRMGRLICQISERMGCWLSQQGRKTRARFTGLHGFDSRRADSGKFCRQEKETMKATYAVSADGMA